MSNADSFLRATSAEYSRWCGAMEVHRRLLDRNPEYAANRATIENTAFAYERAQQTTARQGVIDIPVVVHVVYNTPEQDIGDAQIQSQIEVLNQDYRAANPDVTRVPDVWRDLVSDARVEFHLARTDSLGRPTDGVTRTQTSHRDFDTDDMVKFSLSGGMDAWPANTYLNIWVCQLRRGLLGYAQFPGGAASTDGVVITHTGFGTTGTATAPFNGGRTATHEIGHWLNLRHIWGDDDEGCSGSDFVADTPNQAGPNLGSPAFPRVTCGNGPDGDMFMDFMDYTDDAAMFMFTKGQTARMDAALDHARLPLTRQAVLV
ncbi:zinc metalloprotease [Streptomyces sp. WI03-4A]|uniref:zinc metalloprotease n=1 Tax=Streptomyces sp. WI03-4A TaxID=3028706 RepID=UPI0029A4B7DD|nr:zinc metalloprotease [Streptomyces sp. WI03-4A]MDX2598401.1 zinc metalloprotease [Streptomyces sp. WI03-4A]